MYVLLTKQENGSFNLPIKWEGSNIFDSALKELTQYTLTKDVIPNGDLPYFGIFPISIPKVESGKRLKPGSDKEDSFNGTAVTRALIFEDDPDYTAPKELTEEEQTKIVLDSLVGHTKKDAEKRIIKEVPEWDQRNMSVEFSLMLKQISDGTDLTSEQKTTWDNYKAKWDKITAIRNKSNELEKSYQGKTKEELYKINVTSDDNWK